jgi:hypothetical protein
MHTKYAIFLKYFSHILAIEFYLQQMMLHNQKVCKIPMRLLEGT